MDAPAPLRSDLRVRKIAVKGETTFVIKEPDQQAYYRFDEAQYLMLTLFDGKRQAMQLIDAFDEASDEYAYDEEALNDLIDSAKAFKLLQKTEEEARAAFFEKLRERRRGFRLQAQGSLLFMRFKLLNPKAFFDTIIDSVQFIWSPWGVRVSFLLIGIALFMIMAQGSRFLTDFERVFFFTEQGGWNFFYIWLVAMGAIGFHEIGHGLTCRHFGGEVDDMGFLLLAFQPCFYCNVNDAWLFQNNKHKIYVALAGIWFELVLSALGVFIWSITDVDTLLGRVSFILVTIATASSLFLNLNPLMKFDGYYILSDWLEIPNLRQNALAWFSYTLKRKILRLEVEEPFQPSERERRIFFNYGMLIVVYLTLMLSGLAILGYGWIAEAYGTVGILLFLYLVAKLTKMMIGSWSTTMKEWFTMVFLSSLPRRIVSGLLLFGFVLALFLWTPPIIVLTHGTVEANTRPVNAPENGFVTEIHYQQASRALDRGEDALLFRLESPTLDLEISQFQSRLSTLQLDRNTAMRDNARAEFRRVGIQTHTAEEQLLDAQDRRKKLQVTIPEGSWTVDGPPPLTLKGRYFTRGEVVVTLIPTDSRRFDVILEQSDLRAVRKGNSARIRLIGAPQHVYTGVVQQVTPVSKVEGPNRLFQVRIEMHLVEGVAPPPLGIQGEVMIRGEKAPLWRHVLRPIRATLRTDLWI